MVPGRLAEAGAGMAAVLSPVGTSQGARAGDQTPSPSLWHPADLEGRAVRRLLDPASWEGAVRRPGEHPPCQDAVAQDPTRRFLWW